MALNETHDPGLRSWVASANEPGVDFPIQNLPFAIFRPAQSTAAPRGAVAIGEQIIDLAAAFEAGLFATGSPAAQGARLCGEPTLNALMAAGPVVWHALRVALSQGLREGSAERAGFERCLRPQSDIELVLPAHIGDYTDFYTSIHHATAVGRLFRPDQPLLPNYMWVPIGYHGRSSSVIVSGHSFPRPQGQIMQSGGKGPILAPSRRLDYEAELGIFVGPGNPQGSAIALPEASAHLFGLCLLNDWSARDVQGWEYQPLGPFLGKNFATTISPWVVTLEALEPFRSPLARADGQPAPLPYLTTAEELSRGALDVTIEVALQTASMRGQAGEPVRLSRSSFRHAFWTAGQLIAQHTVNGCNLRPGDLLGTGTLSGPEAAEAGSLLELSDGGKRPLELGNGERRTFLEDGDTVVMRAWCERTGAVRIGFGVAIGTVLPAIPISGNHPPVTAG